MSLERWAEVKRLFHTASELPAGDRARFLAAECGGDETLAQEVAALLKAHDAAPSFLEAGALAAAPELAHAGIGLVEDPRIGPYRVLSELGRGGMGAVYLAVRDDDTYAQEVAIKLIKRGMDTDEILTRFVSERQILANLSHPNIARLLDGGSTADGRPYFVMEAIFGQPIHTYCDERALSIPERLRLLCEVAEAVSFAHQNLVVHRDLKPANVLVGPDGIPKLLDFGIAKLLAPSVDFTAADSRPRTPDYASPEQLAGGPISTATDVHGLGLLLFVLLTGVNPLVAGGGRSFDGEVRPPSDWARADGRKALARQLGGDLDAIVTKALKREPAERYSSVRELIDDLECSLARRPVKARQPTFVYRAGRLIARHRVASGLAATVLLLAVAAIVQSFAALAARDQEERQRRRAEAALALLVGSLRVSDPEQARGADVSVHELLDATTARLLACEQPGPGWLAPSAGLAAADTETRLTLLRVIGEIRINLGQPEAALAVLRPALALSVPLQDRDAELERATIELLVARALRDRGELELSKPHSAAALALRQRLLPEGDPRFAEALDELGELRHAAGEADAAEDAFKRATAAARRGGEAATPQLAESLANLATVYLDNARAAEAATLLEEALALGRRLDGPRSPRAAADAILLGSAHYRAGNYELAVARIREGLTLRREIYGPDHPLIGSALSNLGAAERAAGRLKEAIATLSLAVDLYRRRNTVPRPDLADALVNLGDLERTSGHPEDARKHFEEALALDEQLAEDRRAARANVLNHLAQLAGERGEYESAEDLAQRAIALGSAAFGPEDVRVAALLNSRASILARAGRFNEAEAVYREALRLRLLALPADHPDVATSLVGLGSTLLSAGRLDEAEGYLRKGLEIRRQRLPADHPRTAQAEGLLGRCLLALGRTTEAETLLKSSHRILQALHGDTHPETRDAARNLAEVAARRGLS